MIDPYQVLGLNKDATSEEIQSAYRKAAFKYHPDQNLGDSAVESFKKVNSAYELLSDPIKKSQYDRSSFQFRKKPRKQQASNQQYNSPPPGFDYENVVGDFFGGSSYKGRNITVRLEINLKEVYTGCVKYIKVQKKKRCFSCDGKGYSDFNACHVCSGSGAVQIPDSPFQFLTKCPYCKGSGKSSLVKCGDCLGTCFLPGLHDHDLKVNIPGGIENGMQIRLTGEGEDSIRGSGVDGRAGDVVVFVIVKDHPIFQRQGKDLLVEVPVSYTQLVLGGEIQIPTIAGEIVKVTIPEASQSHTKFRLKGKGLKIGHASGDLIATVKTETPKNLSPEYKEVLKQLANLEKINITPRRQEWDKNMINESK